MQYDLIPEDLIDARERADLTVKQAAKELNCTEDYLRKMERGDRYPSPAIQYAMCELYNVEFKVRSSVRHPLWNKAIKAS